MPAAQSRCQSRCRALLRTFYGLSRHQPEAHLSRAVKLLGRLPYEGCCFNSADVFLQGSHYEGSGLALADALACGVAPVVTDIPSFRS